MTRSEFLVVIYRCDGCGAHEVAVPSRRRNQEITDWIKNEVRPAIRRHHRAYCPVTEYDIVLPISESAGMKVER